MLENDVLKMMEGFHRFGRIVKGLNPTFIVLIPKKSESNRIEDFRPISLVGCMYKIIAKVLSRRLRKVLECIISENQSAFLGGR